MKQDLHQLTGNCRELKEVLQLAQESDKKAERNKNIGCATGFLAGIFLLFAFPIVMEAESISSVALPIGVACLLVWSIWFYKKNDKFDIEDDKLALLSELLPLLEVDTKETQALKVNVDFRPASHETPEFVAEEKVVGSSFYGQVKAYKIRQKWLELQGRLVDGTAYKLEIERLNKSKVKPKKKSRTKTKSRLQERLIVSLRPSPSRYPHLTQLRQKLPANPPNSLKLLSVQSEESQVRAVFETPGANVVSYRGQEEQGMEHLASAHNAAGALVFLYRGLKSLKAQAIKG